MKFYSSLKISYSESLSKYFARYVLDKVCKIGNTAHVYVSLGLIRGQYYDMEDLLVFENKL